MTTATPAVKSAFEISLARQKPNAEDMISIARGNDESTPQVHAKLFRKSAFEYASAAATAMSTKASAPTAALDAVAAAPQPS